MQNKNQKVVILNLFQDLHLRRGFTLIELLVVVLIIGILAAVAVPQYQKAVERSRATEAMSMLSSIAKAYQVYYLANGNYATTFEELDVDIPLRAIRSFMARPKIPNPIKIGHFKLKYLQAERYFMPPA